MSEALTAISPIDGRYWNSVKSLSNYFSEFALHKYRVQVEIEYFIALCGILPPLQDFPKENFENMRKIYQNFDLKDAEQIKATEAKTNHDVKAVEYFVKDEVLLLFFYSPSSFIFIIYFNSFQLFYFIFLYSFEKY